MYHLPRPPVSLSRDDWFYHSMCVCNHTNALVQRVGLCVPLPRGPRLIDLREKIATLARIVGIRSSMSLQEVVNSFQGPKRRRYERAKSNLEKFGIDFVRDSRVKMFVKFEAIKFDKLKVKPSCRAIQFRSFEYTLLVMAGIRNAENAMYRSVGEGFGSFPKTRFISKGMNCHQKAALLWAKYCALAGCLILLLDAKRFDSHVTATLLLFERFFWYSCTMNKRLNSLLKRQLNNRGYFIVDGKIYRYSVKDGRMSGEANTAGGNNALMASMLAVFGDWLVGTGRIKAYDFLVDGDDSVFFYVPVDGKKLDSETVYKFFEELGMTMQIEDQPRDFEQITFCQARPCLVDGEWMMVRNPRKVLSKTTINHKFSITIPKLLKTIALGELSLSPGVPILQCYYLRLIHLADLHMSKRGRKDGGLIRNYDHGFRVMQNLPVKWWEAKPKPISLETRLSFRKAWDISVDEQLETEERIAMWNPDFSLITRSGSAIDPIHWEYDWFKPEDSY